MENSMTEEQQRRRGRPRREDAGEVEERILNAASAVFHEHGFGRATMDQIAEAARAGKTSLYSRYPTKAELFAAVVRRSSAQFAERMSIVITTGSLRERMIATGIELADATLTAESIALMRSTSAEAEAYPDVAQEGFAIGFGECVRSVAASLADPGALDPDTELARVTPVATRFVEMALHPLYMHAFFGADLEVLRERARAEVVQVADVLLPLVEDGDSDASA